VPPSAGTITYYHDRAVQVTSEAILVDDQVYLFEQLSRVWHRREKKPWRELAGRGFWGVTYLFPFLGAVIGFTVAIVLDLPLGARATIVVAAIVVGLSAGPLLDPILGKLDSSFDRGLHIHEIWVERYGVEILVLQTRDASRFGRIYRAVQRAAGA
jgi:uncharacterized protein DUF6232